MTIIDEYLDYQTQYTKEYGSNTCVLMQIGHFYEAYAVENEKEKTNAENIYRLSDIMNIQLTRKNKSIQENHRGNPLMIGVNLLSIDKYIQILLNAHYTIVLIEQVTPPPEPERKVTEIYSPGTNITHLTKGDTNNMVCIYMETIKDIKNMKNILFIGLSAIDLSTGKSIVYETYSKIGDVNYALDETFRFIQMWNPKELVVYTNKVHLNDKQICSYLDLSDRIVHFKDIEPHYLNLNTQKNFFEKIYPNHGIISVAEYLDLEKKPYGSVAFILLLEFAHKHNEKIITKIDRPEIWNERKYLILTNNAIHQLNLIAHSSINNNCKYNSLFAVINNTSTTIGKRFLRETLLNPIIDPVELNKRYDYVDYIMKNDYTLYESHLNKIMDIERLHRKITLGILQPAEFVGLDISYDNIMGMYETINSIACDKIQSILPSQETMNIFMSFIRDYRNVFDLNEISKYHLDKITNSFFNKGIYTEIDTIKEQIDNNNMTLVAISKKLSSIVEEGSNFVRLEYTERDGHYLSTTCKRMGILNKKINNMGSNPIKINNDLKFYAKELDIKELNKTQTRITSKFIKKLSSDIRDSQHKIGELSRQRYMEVLGVYDMKYIDMLKEITTFVATIDTYKSIAKTALKYGYTRPIIADYGNDTSFINAKNIRHPIIERLQEDVEYVPNDIRLGGDNTADTTADNTAMDGMLLFGTNASGKSSLMKAVGLNIIMAQAGFYVAASDFTYSPYHSLFTRINNNDNIFKGESSFAVEMSELRNILKRSDNKSLILGDELCSGTESISALSIFTASVKFLSKLKSSFIFATHLHELAKMKQINDLSNISMYHLKVIFDKVNDTLVYNRKLSPGSGDAIYGLEVCKAMDMDYEFLKDANSIRQEIMDIKQTIIPHKVSSYNSNVIVDRCGVCGEDAEDTHHIKFQSEANSEGMINHIQKDTKSNLVPLCKICHDSVHANTLIINGYIKTSRGIVLDYKKVMHKDSAKIRKFDPVQLKTINDYINTHTKLSAKILCLKLQQDHSIKISSSTLSKIKNGRY
jgi:DNA mismatch repair protein MutS